MTQCPICNSEHTVQILDMGWQPTSLLSLTDNMEDSKTAWLRPMQIYMCEICNHVYNSSYDPAVVDYSGVGCRMWNNGTDWTKHVKEQQQRLSMMSCKMFLEIGAGDCTFLDGIKTDAVKMAVDPCEAVERAAEFGIAYKRAPFSVDMLPREGSVCIIMRHLLEHIYSPVEFLREIADAALERDSNTYLFVEVPCIDHALERVRIEDWTYEHPHHFTSVSFVRAQQLAGFQVLEASRGYGDEVLTSIALANSLETINPYEVAEGFDKMQFNLARAGGKLADKLDKVAFWGGAGKSAIFLNAFGVPENAIVVDSDPNKVGLYVPGTGILIRDPAHLHFMRPEIIVATTSWRAEDIRKEIHKYEVSCKQLLKFENGELVEVPLGN
jgi:hypothetical protein